MHMPSRGRPLQESRFLGPSEPAVPRPGTRLGTVVIDAEEDFDWNTPVQGSRTSTAHVRQIVALHEILGSWQAVPTYLLTYPVLEDADAVRILRRQLELGQCAVGLQLHPWVTPPFEETPSRQSSFLGNLGADIEERKLVVLKARFEQCFGFAPAVYRAGRYGLSPYTAGLLEKHGLRIDTSVAPQTSFVAEGGPDYTRHDYGLFWFGSQRRLLEVPLCRSVVGWACGWGSPLYQAMARQRWTRSHLLAAVTRLRCAERITLSPEGNDVAAMRRLVRGLQRRRESVLALSFHSSSLQPGQNPYVQSKADLHIFYDRLSSILDHLVTALRFRFVAIERVPDHLEPPLLVTAP
jgi:hypothetical protein